MTEEIENCRDTVGLLVLMAKNNADHISYVENKMQVSRNKIVYIIFYCKNIQLTSKPKK